MSKTPAPAPAPDPTQLANAQAAANTKAATTQQQLNMVNQVTPQGTLNYEQSGTWADGTPKYTATQAYSPEQQKLYELGNQTQQNIGQIGVDQSARIGELLSTPFKSEAARDNKIVEMQRGFLDPQWEHQAKINEAQLINKGVRPGTAAYDRAMQNFSNNRQDAYNKMYLDAYRTAEGSALTERNQPINEISALLSNSQVSNPSYASTPTAGVAPTDVIGANQLAMNQNNLAYQSQMNQNNAMMSGLFGLASAPLGGWAMGGFKKPW